MTETRDRLFGLRRASQTPRGGIEWQIPMTACWVSTGRRRPQTSTVNTSTRKELDQESFLKLLTMQLSHQDPFKPVDNAQMLSQMTSMSTSRDQQPLHPDGEPQQPDDLEPGAPRRRPWWARTCSSPPTRVCGEGGSPLRRHRHRRRRQQHQGDGEGTSGQVVKEFSLEGTTRGTWPSSGMARTSPAMRPERQVFDRSARHRGWQVRERARPDLRQGGERHPGYEHQSQHPQSSRGWAAST